MKRLPCRAAIGGAMGAGMIGGVEGGGGRDGVFDFETRERDSEVSKR